MKTGGKEIVSGLLRKCGVGDRHACDAAKVMLFGAYEIAGGATVTFASVKSGDEHPNKMPFKGVLLLTDTASTKPPHGAKGHRILVPTKVAQKRLKTLVGMAVNYDQYGLDGHATRHKVGVVTRAWIEGIKVWVEGFIYKKDFPEAEKDLKDRSDLGMSMELAEVYVRDEDEEVWHLQDFQFTGATILKKNAAAYYQTALAAKAVVASRKGEKKMDKNKKKRVAAAGDNSVLLRAIKNAVKSEVSGLASEIKASGDKQERRFEQLEDGLEELRGLHTIAAAGEVELDAKADDDDDDMDAKSEDDDDDMDAKSDEDDDDMDAKSDDDDDDMDAAKKSKSDDDEDDTDDEELDAALEDLEDEDTEEEPGEINKNRGGKNKGKKNSVTDPPRQGAKVPGNIAEGRLSSAASGKRPFPGIKSASIQAAATKIATLTAAAQRAEKRAKLAEIKAARAQQGLKKMGRKIDRIEAQNAKYAEQENRRSVIPAELRNLAAKANVNLYDMRANGQKLSVEAVDSIFGAAEQQGIQIDPEQRMGLKNRLLEQGLMDMGQVDRTLQ